MAPPAPLSAGISYDDVAALLRQVESEHCCNLSFNTSVPMRSGTPVLLWVRIDAVPRLVGRKTIRASLSVSRSWPHVDHRTMAGLMLYLVYEVAARLESAGHLPAEQAQSAFA